MPSGRCGAGRAAAAPKSGGHDRASSTPPARPASRSARGLTDLLDDDRARPVRGGAGRPGRDGARRTGRERGAGAARRLRPARRGPVFRRRPDDPARAAVAADRVAPLANRLLRDVFDAGLDLGQSVRTPAQACQLARAGRDDLHVADRIALPGRQREPVQPFRRAISDSRRNRRWSALVLAIEERAAKERPQFGETVYLLEPNVKRSRGGLRDIQLLRWLGFARYGTADPDGLRLSGSLSKADHDVIRRASRVPAAAAQRNALSRRQVERRARPRRAGAAGRVSTAISGTAGLLPVEQFMREYFRMTNGVATVVGAVRRRRAARPRWSANCWRRSSATRSRAISASARTQICANRTRPGEAARRPGRRSCGCATWPTCTTSGSPTRPGRRFARPCRTLPDEVTPDVGRSASCRCCRQPARLGELLRDLHEIGRAGKDHSRLRARPLPAAIQRVSQVHGRRALPAGGRARRRDFGTIAGPLGRVYRPHQAEADCCTWRC